MTSKDDAKFLAALVFFAVGMITFVAGVACADKIGEITNSGLLGICGPYGRHADLVGCIFLGSVPIAVVSGLFAAKFCYRRLRKRRKN